MKKIIKHIIPLIILVFGISGCDYLDVVPDNVATIDNAFTLRNTAEKYLFTCYRYLPSHSSFSANPAFLGGDEIWTIKDGAEPNTFHIAQGNQNVNSPLVNYWDGGSEPYKGIRDCNIFMENIDNVPDLTNEEKIRWISEVKFLKAYYHFWLLRMYGPIPIIKENISIAADPSEVRVEREPVDDCVDYIVQLLDESLEGLPEFIEAELTENGRITKQIALSVKALVLVTAASPIFNGNQDYTGFNNSKGVPLINPEFSEEKWQLAKTACKEAVEFCHQSGRALYTFAPEYGFNIESDVTKVKMGIRNAVTQKWNQEIIWGNPNSLCVDLQRACTPGGLDPAYGSNVYTRGNFAPPLKMAELFYSKNGVPIDEDKEYDYAGRFSIKTVGEEDKYNLQLGYRTVGLHFDREPRFYADLAFDGGLWFGQGKLDDSDQWVIQCKAGQYQSAVALNRYSVTGYRPKKLVNYENIISETLYTIQEYPWPVIRLADLYLLFAEAINESDGPTDEAMFWVDLVRERAGLNTIKESWSRYSKYPNKYTTQDGLREIIQQERLIELAFEGKRFWDLRRWKLAHIELNKPISGWDIDQEKEENYYRERLIINQTFLTRDYFWPIRESNLTVNKNLVQNPGW